MRLGRSSNMAPRVSVSLETLSCDDGIYLPIARTGKSGVKSPLVPDQCRPSNATRKTARPRVKPPRHLSDERLYLICLQNLPMGVHVFFSNGEASSETMIVYIGQNSTGVSDLCRLWHGCHDIVSWEVFDGVVMVLDRSLRTISDNRLSAIYPSHQ